MSIEGLPEATGKLIDLARFSDEFPPDPLLEPELAAEVSADAYEALGELLNTVARFAHDCGITATELAEAITEAMGIKTIKPEVGMDDIIGALLVDENGPIPDLEPFVEQFQRKLREFINGQ